MVVGLIVDRPLHEREDPIGDHPGNWDDQEQRPSATDSNSRCDSPSRNNPKRHNYGYYKPVS
jgi:hypothetical protein